MQSLTLEGVVNYCLDIFKLISYPITNRNSKFFKFPLLELLSLFSSLTTVNLKHRLIINHLTLSTTTINLLPSTNWILRHWTYIFNCTIKLLLSSSAQTNSQIQSNLKNDWTLVAWVFRKGFFEKTKGTKLSHMLLSKCLASWAIIGTSEQNNIMENIQILLRWFNMSCGHCMRAGTFHFASLMFLNAVAEIISFHFSNGHLENHWHSSQDLCCLGLNPELLKVCLL